MYPRTVNLNRNDFLERRRTVSADTEGPRPNPMPIAPLAFITRKKWTGRWVPRLIKTTPHLGALAGPDDSDPESYYPAATPASPAQPSAWSSFLDTLGSAAAKIAQIKATGIVQQQQQKTLAQTWNPAITGPALQGQAYQNLYNQGTGILPSSLNLGTVALIGAGLLGVYLIAKK